MEVLLHMRNIESPTYTYQSSQLLMVKEKILQIVMLKHYSIISDINDLLVLVDKTVIHHSIMDSCERFYNKNVVLV
jgi:hypothetical protein